MFLARACPALMVTSISITDPAHALRRSVEVMEGSVFWENCRWTFVVAPSEGDLTHAGSATKTMLSSVGGLDGGVLRIGITEHRQSDPAAVQDLLGWWPPNGLALICFPWTAAFGFCDLDCQGGSCVWVVGLNSV